LNLKLPIAKLTIQALGLFNAKTKNMAWDIYGAKNQAFSCQSKL